MRVLSALMFFPRGGSAHVARALCGHLPAHGWDVTLLTGSTAGHGDARRFYAGLHPHVVDFDAGDAPMHPSYEDRPGAPDPVFAMVGPERYERHVGAWARALQRAGAAEHDVLHLHHLTPLNEAAELVAPGVPVVGHLHGTELLMLERIDEGAPPHWLHAEEWAERLRRWAAACERILVLTPSHVARASALLGLDPERFVVSPNGVDPAVFGPRTIDRAAFWRSRLGVVPSSPVLLFVGRFTAVKRVPLLVRAWATATRHVHGRPSLVLVGGHPGELEGEHPADVAEAVGARNLHLAGWVEHDVLAHACNAADAIVLPSVREQFGSVLVEGMACGLPAIAVDRFGPSEIVRDGETGWLVEPDDETGLARAMVHAVNDPAERRRRGAAARQDVGERFAWPSIAAQLAGVLNEVAGATAGDVALR